MFLKQTFQTPFSDHRGLGEVNEGWDSFPKETWGEIDLLKLPLNAKEKTGISQNF